MLTVLLRSASNATKRSNDVPSFEVVVSMCNYSGDCIAVVSSMDGSCMIYVPIVPHP